VKEEMKDRIKGLRNKKGITQAGLGEILGVSQNAISLIEKGTNKPTVQQIEILSVFFEVSADYLLFGRENIKPIEYDFLRLIRDNKTVFDALIRAMNSNNYFESLAA
jgi:transcriptional regulator with XRE-family HTH domain